MHCNWLDSRILWWGMHVVGGAYVTGERPLLHRRRLLTTWPASFTPPHHFAQVQNESIRIRQPSRECFVASHCASATAYQTIQGDQRLAHDSGKAIDADALGKLGVLYYRIPELDGVNELAKERGYRNRDEIFVSPEKMGAIYEEKVKTFFHEHLHEDEEIRYIRDGQGYFDVRAEDESWIRIHLGKDDLIILPAGIYHRFTTDESNVSSFA